MNPMKFTSCFTILMCILSAVVAERMVVTYEPGTGREVLDQLKSQGWSLVVDIPEGNSFTVTRPDSAANGARAAVVSELTSLTGINHAQPDAKIYLQACDSGPINSLFTAADGTTETWPWGIRKVQADDPKFINAGSDNIVYCVLDTGLDPSHPDLAASGNTIKGCSPPECMYEWNKDALGHGTHTTGTIAARRNGAGVVGVHNSGAHVYVINIFGDAGVMDESSLVPAWDSCIKYLDSIKTSKPDAKMVISMSIGGPGPGNNAISAKVDALYKRGDVIFIGAAGNAGTSAVSYPAGYANVVSVAAVDSNNKIGAFSQKNSDVEISAPGVGILSTAATGKSGFPIANALSVAPSALGGGPAPTAIKGSSGTATGQVRDCSTDSCAGALCLVGAGDMCSQVAACKAAGGVGIIFTSDSDDECAALTNGSVEGCSFPAAGVSISQANQLRASGASATINGDAKPDGFTYKTGTSMATPHVSGVAGLVWSYYPKCSGAEIRKALTATAVSVGPNGGAGLIQAKAAVDYLANNPCTGPPQTPSPSPKPLPVITSSGSAGTPSSTIPSAGPVASPKPTVLKPKTPRKPKAPTNKPKVSSPKPKPGRKMI